MRKVIPIITILAILVSCKKDKETQQAYEVVDYTSIKEQLERMVINDQNIQFAFRPNQSQNVKDSILKEKDRIFKANTDTIQSLFNQYGYLGIDKVDEDGAHNFWVLVQHSDSDINFQEQVLTTMKVELEIGNVNSSNYAFLVDRVQKNKGEKQLYGTQLEYRENFWIVPEPIKDSINVNKRRKAIGLPPLEEYLNTAMEANYHMNKSAYEKLGLKGPNKYEVNNL